MTNDTRFTIFYGSSRNLFLTISVINRIVDISNKKKRPLTVICRDAICDGLSIPRNKGKIYKNGSQEYAGITLRKIDSKLNSVTTCNKNQYLASLVEKYIIRYESERERINNIILKQ